MSIRRLYLRWMFLAVPVLPLWPLIGWGIFDGGGGGWDFLGLVVAMPILAVALLIVALIFYGRTSVRAARALEWRDIGVLLIWHLSIIGFGFFGPAMSWFGVIGVIAGLVALWFALSQLIRETTQRSRAAMAEFERLARQQQAPGFTPQTGFIPGPGFRPGDDDDEIIVIQEHPRDPQR